jgi:hypothetical protein
MSGKDKEDDVNTEENPMTGIAEVMIKLALPDLEEIRNAIIKSLEQQTPSEES